MRVEDVVAEARAAKGTFYAYFDSWDDLLDTIRQRTIAELERDAAPVLALGAGTDWHKVLPSLSVLLVDFITASGGLHDALFHSDFTRSRPMPPETRLAARIAGILRAGMAAGAYVDLDAEPTSQLISAIIHEFGRPNPGRRRSRAIARSA